uniref:Ionotropic glutamate receptor C-terminal domain-containing protein n=1 Tax=Anopheles quadriannulatus TaxID=34691 RepID=A0A182WTC9_ANOQN
MATGACRAAAHPLCSSGDNIESTQGRFKWSDASPRNENQQLFGHTLAICASELYVKTPNRTLPGIAHICLWQRKWQLPYTARHYGSRYFIFHPKLKENIFMNELDSGKLFILDRAYHILYNRSSVEIHHKNFFTNQSIQLDPSDIRVPNDLKNLYGRKLRLVLPAGNLEITTFDAYLGETIARQRNGTFEATTSTDGPADYGVLNMGVSFLGTDKILALGSTFISVLVPHSKPKPIIWVLVDPFDYYSWIALFSLIFVLAVVLSLFGDVLNKSSVVDNALEMIMCLLGGPSRTYGGWFEQQIITNYCLLSIVIVSCYQSLIISYLSYTRFFPEINSADEIRNNCIFPPSTKFSNHLNLPLSKPGDSLDNMCYLFYSRDNTHITTLLIENMRNIDKAAHAAFKHNLRVASTVFLKYHLLYYFFDKSLIRELFPFYIHAFFESGLFDQYYKNKSSFALLYRQDVLAGMVRDLAHRPKANWPATKSAPFGALLPGPSRLGSGQWAQQW